MDISCAFATTLDTPENIVLAERLGYYRAWCYDSPTLNSDVWMALALAAERTDRIQLGAGILIPHFRHVTTTAAAIATLAGLAPGRVAAAFGTGFTGRLTLGKPPLRWSEVRSYVSALRALLRGEETEWNGATIRMMQPNNCVASYPIDVPILISALGPKGAKVVSDLGDGIFTIMPRGDFPWVAQLVHGTVLGDGEEARSERAVDAASPGAALLYHFNFCSPDQSGLKSLPGGRAWRETAERVLAGSPERTRHLAVHEGHLMEANEIDREVITGDMLEALGYALDRSAWRRRLDDIEAAGVTELVYQPAGSDIQRELIAFAEMAQLSQATSQVEAVAAM